MPILSLSQNARNPQRQIKHLQLLIRAVDKPLIDLGKDHEDLVLVLVGDGVVVYDCLIELAWQHALVSNVVRGLVP